MCNTNSTSRGDALAPDRHNSIQCTILPDKSCAIKGLVVCYVVWLGSMKGMGLGTNARFVDLITCCDQDGYRAQVQQHPIET